MATAETKIKRPDTTKAPVRQSVSKKVPVLKKPVSAARSRAKSTRAASSAATAPFRACTSSTSRSAASNESCMARNVHEHVFVFQAKRKGRTGRPSFAAQDRDPLSRIPVARRSLTAAASRPGSHWWYPTGDGYRRSRLAHSRSFLASSLGRARLQPARRFGRRG